MTKQSIPIPKRICQVEGCKGKYYLKGYCNKHYLQMKRHGKIFRRTIFDPNEFIFDGKICRIKLYNKQGKEKAEAIIDAEDYERVRSQKWHFVRAGYVITSIRSNSHRLHWAIIGKPSSGYHTDHINGNKLDNRKKNLRFCTNPQNLANRGKQKNNTSGFKGVFLDEENNKWIAQLVHKGKRVLYKRFESKTEAAQKYNETALKYCEDFAYINGI